MEWSTFPSTTIATTSTKKLLRKNSRSSAVLILVQKNPKIKSNYSLDFLTEEVKFGIQNFFDLNNDRQFTESELTESYYYITRKFIEIYLQYTSANRDGWLLNEIQSVFEVSFFRLYSLTLF